VDVQINACLFYIFRSVCERGVVVWGSLYFINSLQKTRQPPSCIVKFFQILSSSCIHLILVILFFWMGGGRENKILQKKIPNRAFHFFTTIKLIYTLVYINLWTVFFLCFLKYESFSNCEQSYYRNIGYFEGIYTREFDISPATWRRCKIWEWDSVFTQMHKFLENSHYL